MADEMEKTSTRYSMCLSGKSVLLQVRPVKRRERSIAHVQPRRMGYLFMYFTPATPSPIITTVGMERRRYFGFLERLMGPIPYAPIMTRATPISTVEATKRG